MCLFNYAQVYRSGNRCHHKGGAYRYVSKPWNDRELLLAVKNAFEKYRLVKENRYLTELTRQQNEELKKWSAELEFYVQQQNDRSDKTKQGAKKLNEKLTKNVSRCWPHFKSDRTQEPLDAQPFKQCRCPVDSYGKSHGLPEPEIEMISTASQLMISAWSVARILF